jgi:uncharacterized OsmC-like protein
MSAQDHIRQSLQGLIQYYNQNPDKAVGPDKEAVAIIEEGLRARATGPDGQTLICDMPRGLGGAATAPSPGWMMRAALANCEAIMISLRAAQLGIHLTTLEVRVESTSDDRCMLGMDDSKPAGPLNVKVGIRISADPASEGRLREIIQWAEQHSPVGESLHRVMPLEYAIELADQ